MAPGPEAPQPEAPKEVKATKMETPEEKQTRVQNEEFDKLVKEAPGKSNKQLSDKFGEYKDAKKEEGGNKAQEAKLHGDAIQELAKVLMGKGTEREKNAAVNRYLKDWGKKAKAREITFKEAEVVKGERPKKPTIYEAARTNPFLRESLAKYKAEHAQKPPTLLTAEEVFGPEEPNKLASRETSPGEKARKAGEEVQKAYEPGKTEGTEVVLKFTGEQEREFGALAMTFYTKLDAGNHVDNALANAGEKITTNDLNKAIGKLRNNVPFDKAEGFIKDQTRSAETLAIQASQAQTPQEYKRVATSTKAMLERINNFKG